MADNLTLVKNENLIVGDHYLLELSWNMTPEELPDTEVINISAKLVDNDPKGKVLGIFLGKKNLCDDESYYFFWVSPLDRKNEEYNKNLYYAVLEFGSDPIEDNNGMFPDQLIFIEEKYMNKIYIVPNYDESESDIDEENEDPEEVHTRMTVRTYKSSPELKAKLINRINEVFIKKRLPNEVSKLIFDFAGERPEVKMPGKGGRRRTRRGRRARGAAKKSRRSRN
jgi:hypothetical protein